MTIVVCPPLTLTVSRSTHRHVNPSVRLHLYVVKPSLLDKVTMLCSYRPVSVGGVATSQFHDQSGF